MSAINSYIILIICNFFFNFRDGNSITRSRDCTELDADNA